MSEVNSKELTEAMVAMRDEIVSYLKKHKKDDVLTKEVKHQLRVTHETLEWSVEVMEDLKRKRTT